MSFEEHLGTLMKRATADLGAYEDPVVQQAADEAKMASIRVGVEDARGTVCGRLGDLAVTAIDVAATVAHHITE